MAMARLCILAFTATRRYHRNGASALLRTFIVRRAPLIGMTPRPRGLPLIVALAAICLSGPAVGARERQSPPPPTDTEVFAGSEELTHSRGSARPPAVSYWKLHLSARLEPSPRPVHVQMVVPLSDDRQSILARRFRSEGLRYREETDMVNLWAHWGAEALQEPREIVYEVAARIEDREVPVPAVGIQGWPIPDAVQPYLEPSHLVQSNARNIRRKAQQLTGTAVHADHVLWALYQYTAGFLRAEAPDAPQDALSVLRAERGNTVGRARLLVAFLRSLGLPARLVGGLRLEHAGRKRSTISWVECFVDGSWVPLDPSGGHFGWIPNNYLALYRGDLPLFVRTASAGFEYEFSMRQTTQRSLEAAQAEDSALGALPPRAVPLPGAPVRAVGSWVTAPVASVVLLSDRALPDGATERILDEAKARSVNVVILTARDESRYFRETYLQRVVTNNLALIRDAHMILVVTRDEAGLYALLALGERGIRLADARVVVSGRFRQAVGELLGSMLYRLTAPGELVVADRPIDVLSLWEIARTNLLDGVPIRDEAARWNVHPLIFSESDHPPARAHGALVRLWARAVRAEIPLQAVILILMLPIIATIVVVGRNVIGIESFGTFSPVIVSLAFLTTGLLWGTLIFVTIVGLGVLLRTALQRLRLQLVPRLAILIGLVSVVMAGLTLAGAALGIGPLMNMSIFPMVIMAGVIENFAASQAELGTREAVRLTVNTLALSVICYLAVDRTGMQSLVLVYPQILLAAFAVNLALGKWRGLRLLEYVRFYDLVRRGEAGAAGRIEPSASRRP
jgi:hypothetical protein